MSLPLLLNQTLKAQGVRPGGPSGKTHPGPYSPGTVITHQQARVFQDGDSPLGGPLARLVRIIADDSLIGVAADDTRLLLREGSAQGGNGIGEARPVQGDDVHVALCQDQLPGAGVLGEVHSEQAAALVVHRGVGCIDILGLSSVRMRPPKATTLPRRSKMGNMTRPR